MQEGDKTFMSKEYDLVVLGGGIGGYVAAIRATQLGMKTAIVEKKKLGGTCLHEGCIPTKALLRTAEVYRNVKQASTFGIDVEHVSLNFIHAHKRKTAIIDGLYKGVQSLIEKNSIDLYEGHGRILGPSIFSPMAGTISIEHGDGQENTILVPKYVLIATGSIPNELPGVEVDGKNILHTTEALQLETLPKSMTIIGGGIIGVEWASLLSDFGVKVTIIEKDPSILMTEDIDVQQTMERALRKRGVTIYTNANVHSDSLTVSENEVSMKILRETETILVESEKILVAIGRRANSDDIGLDNTSIELENSFIQTNEVYQTKETHMYAIGDCIGGMQLAHVASHEGIIAVEHMAGKKTELINPLHIPSCIYSFPEAAKVGLTEQEVKEKGYSYKIGRFPFQGIGKAHVFGETTGFLKIIVDEQTDDILGIHLVGPNATDMISEASLAKVLDATAWEISQTIHPHPSLSEIFFEAALAVEDEQIHG